MSYSTLRRLGNLLSRRKQAKALGFGYSRARDFRFPRALRIAAKDVPFHVPDEDGIRVAFLDVLLDDCYGLRRLRGRGIERILDIGGNVGIFALAARQAFPQATIHAYEPNPRMLPFLTQHAAAAGFSCFAEAVGKDDGHISLVEHQDCVQVRTQADAAGNIPQIAFRRAIERISGHCHLVKLDCEGAEWEILADTESWQHVDHLAMEYHLWAGDRRHDEIGPLMDAIGFRIERQSALHPEYGIVWASRRTTP
jgi:FkbM family methyltransferase